MYREKIAPVLRWPSLAAAFAAVTLAAGACDLDIENPNAPDAPRAFEDPAGLQQLLGGSFRTWVSARGGYFVYPLTTIADSYSASWNNAASRYYSSVGSDCPQRCGWNNSATAPEAAGGPTVEWQWYTYYTVHSAATDVLRAVADGICFDLDCGADNTLTSRNTAIAKMLQGMALTGIALMYDQGFAVDETTDLSTIADVPFASREEMRDFALQKFEEAWQEAGQASWSVPSEWMGVGAGRVYSNEQMRQLIRTMQAELIAMWPRNAAENAQADWAQVASFASQGVSAGGFDWEFFIDATLSECPGDDGEGDCLKVWGNSIGTMRVDTRVASFITDNHVTPWPEPDGNPCPTVSSDLRVGDGSYGPEDDFSGYATTAATANAGTDFACSGVPLFPPARGQYHQSNLQHVRYQYLGYASFGETLPDADGTGHDPLYTQQMNDLLWAEGLLRSGGNRVQAAQLINNSRVGRGGLPALTGAESDAELLAALQYEQEIEFMGQGATPFFNRRRVDGLVAQTPRHMPVPARELDVLLREIYTFGGPGAPEMSYVGTGKSKTRIRSVREIAKDLMAQAAADGKRRR